MTLSAPAAPPTAEELFFSLDRWGEGQCLEQLLVGVQSAVDGAVRRETELRGAVRGEILAKLRTMPGRPASAGVYTVPDRVLRAARRRQLLGGDATACDGASAGHDGLAATVAAVGVCLVRYDGAVHSWRNSFYRSDYESKVEDPVGRLRELLDRQGKRQPLDGGAPDATPGLLRRGFMACAERQALADKATTRWRIGHGTPVPVEVLANAGCPQLLDAALPALERLLFQHERWVFLPETSANRTLLTVANALNPGEVAVFQSGKPMIDSVLEVANIARPYRARAAEFADRLGKSSVVGGFRATRQSPAQLFVAPAGRAVEAGVVALADATLSPARGFPLLLQLATLGARTGLGLESFGAVVEAAYAKARRGRLGHDGAGE